MWLGRTLTLLKRCTESFPLTDGQLPWAASFSTSTLPWSSTFRFFLRACTRYYYLPREAMQLSRWKLTGRNSDYLTLVCFSWSLYWLWSSLEIRLTFRESMLLESCSSSSSFCSWSILAWGRLHWRTTFILSKPIKRHRLIPPTPHGYLSLAQPTHRWWVSWEAAFTATTCRYQLWPMQSTPSTTIVTHWPDFSSFSWPTVWLVWLEFMALQDRTLRRLSQVLIWSSRTAWIWCHLRTIWLPLSEPASFVSSCAWTPWSLASFVRKFYFSTKV